MRFTHSKIEALKRKEKRYIVWETSGLGVRIEPTGTKVFCLFYRINGRGVQYTIGRFPKHSLADARAFASKVRSQVSQGIDPVEEKRMELANRKNGFTVRHLAHEFWERWSKPQKRTWKEDVRCLEREVLPKIGDKPAVEVTRRDVVSVLDSISDRGCGAMANRTLNVVSKMFRFGVQRDLIPASPCIEIPMPSKKIKRDRVLSEREIRIFWLGMPNSGISAPCQLGLKLILAIGQRRSEVIEASWSEFNLKSGWWEIPGVRTKNGKKHLVPLNTLALEIIKEIRQISGPSRFLFPSGRKDDSPMDPRAVTRALKKAQEHFDLPPFRAHDLRRTFVSQLASLGINRLLIQKLINHSDGETIDIYDRHGYQKEKMAAIGIFGEALSLIIDGGKAEVITLGKNNYPGLG